MAKILSLYALCGSQRRASSNRALLEALKAAATADVGIEICEMIGDLPIFNPDEEGERTPAVVTAFAGKIRAADGLIVSTPEYVHGVPGGLKNALDWLVSRDEIPHKPVMLAHASHRGDIALDQITDILTTMSLRLVPAAHLRVPLLGLAGEARAEALSKAAAAGLLADRLAIFAADIRAGRAQ